MSTDEVSGALTPEELLAFGALARALVRADGVFSEAEEEALEQVSSTLFAAPNAEPYRSMPAELGVAPKNDAIWELLDRAAVALPDEDATREAARGVTRQQARETIYAALYEIAASDTVVKSEWSILDWLTKEWGISG